jgi:hypothetical protein
VHSGSSVSAPVDDELEVAAAAGLDAVAFDAAAGLDAVAFDAAGLESVIASGSLSSTVSVAFPLKIGDGDGGGPLQLVKA